MHEAEVIGSFSCSTHHWLLDQKSAFLMYWVCMASAICKQLKKTGDIYLSSRVFGKMTRTQPIDESLNLERLSRGTPAQTKTRGRNFQPPAAGFSGAGHF
jgi:hypothetical protein